MVLHLPLNTEYLFLPNSPSCSILSMAVKQGILLRPPNGGICRVRLSPTLQTLGPLPRTLAVLTQNDSSTLNISIAGFNTNFDLWSGLSETPLEEERGRRFLSLSLSEINFTLRGFSLFFPWLILYNISFSKKNRLMIHKLPKLGRGVKLCQLHVTVFMCR